MDLTILEKLSREELVGIIERLGGQYDFDITGKDERTLDFRTIVEAAYDVIFVVDRDKRIIFMNKAWSKTFPSREARPGKPYRDYLYEIEQERGNLVVDSVLKHGHVFENELLKTYENGTPYYFVTTFSPIKSKNGEIYGLIGVMRNYTEQRVIQKKLRDNTRMLEDKVKEQIKQAEELKNLRDLNEEIINNAPIGIILADPSGIVISENPNLSQIMFRNPDTLSGFNLTKYEGFVESGLKDSFETAVNLKKTVRVSEAKYMPVSGEKLLAINVTLDPIFNRAGDVEKVLIMIEDVTAQEEIRKKISKNEKMTSLGLLASGVASELKNHINKMFMDLNFIHTNVDEHSPASEYVDALKIELQRIKIISEQLLSLSIIDERDKELCEINKIITGHPLDVLINKIRNEGVDVDIILPEESLVVYAIPNQLTQIFIQLFENAEDAVNGFGKISIKVEPVEVISGNYVSVTVSDTGMGIPEEHLKKIFQPFYTTKGKKGTGLGLMIIMNIIDNLGGTIGLKTSPGEGTSFRIMLPLAEQ